MHVKVTLVRREYCWVFYVSRAQETPGLEGQHQLHSFACHYFDNIEIYLLFCVHRGCMCRSIGVEVRGKLVGHRLSPSAMWILVWNSCLQAWQRAPIPAEAPYHSIFFSSLYLFWTPLLFLWLLLPKEGRNENPHGKGESGLNYRCWWTKAITSSEALQDHSHHWTVSNLLCLTWCQLTNLSACEFW